MTSDADGLARIPGGLVRGSGGDEPFAVMAYGKDGDFNFLEVGRAAFDLSDRGVTGRPQPGPVDAYLYTDRGIYRPGETVHLIGAGARRRGRGDGRRCRSPRGLLRPDGVEVERRQITGDRLGAYELSYQPGARRPDRQLAGRVSPRPEGAADRHRSSSASRISCRRSSKWRCPPATGRSRRARRSRSRSRRATTTARPGRNWRSRREATIAFDEDPFPNEPGFQFGLASEEFAGDAAGRRCAGDRRRRQIDRLADADRSSRPDEAARRDRARQRRRAERARRDRNASRGRSGSVRWRSDCAPRTAMRRCRKGRRLLSRSSPSIPTAGGSPPRGCAGNCCARPGNTTGIRSTASGGTGRQVRDVPVETGTLDIEDGRAGVAFPEPAAPAGIAGK